MALVCDPAALTKAAACFQCIPKEMQEDVELYLLAVIAGGSTDPKVLSAAAAGFRGVANKDEVRLYLLCKAAGGT